MKTLFFFFILFYFNILSTECPTHLINLNVYPDSSDIIYLSNKGESMKVTETELKLCRGIYWFKVSKNGFETETKQKYEFKQVYAYYNQNVNIYLIPNYFYSLKTSAFIESNIKKKFDLNENTGFNLTVFGWMTKLSINGELFLTYTKNTQSLSLESKINVFPENKLSFYFPQQLIIPTTLSVKYDKQSNFYYEFLWKTGIIYNFRNFFIDNCYSLGITKNTFDFNKNNLNFYIGLFIGFKGLIY